MTDTHAPGLTLAAPAAPLVDTAARTIAGLAVPYGPSGQTSMGRLAFGPGSLAWSSPRRVKLLREHDQRDALGHAVSLEEIDAAEADRRLAAGGAEPVGVGGLWATYRVPEGDNGDRALAEAANGVRDALSVGVQLSDATASQLRKAAASGGTQTVQGSGVLRETSLVSVPAFDDARVGSVAAHAELVVASWHTTTPTEGNTTMQLATATQPTEPTQPAPAQPTQPAPAQPTQPAPGQPQPQQPTPHTHPDPQQPQPQPVQPVQPAAPAQAAAAPLAVAGAALMVGGEPATYRFDGSDSLVVDAAKAHFLGDFDARQRMARFNAELAAGNPSSVMALAAVMETADAPELINQGQPTNRPELLRTAIDRGRPINSRINSVPLRNANPFVIPVEGEFTGIGDHTEGTAHRPEGTLTVDDSPVVTPKAVSGAFRMSRELVDSTNPAIDRLALRAMMRGYRRDTEARAYAALGAATDAVGGITTVQAVRGQLIDFIDDDTEVSFILVGKGFLTTLSNDVDGDGRPMLPFTNPVNASGSLRAGYTGADIDGNPVIKATSITTDRALIVDANDVLIGESAVQQFRFEEVEGPGIIKLALWAYYVAAVLDATGVRELSTAAEPVA